MIILIKRSFCQIKKSTFRVGFCFLVLGLASCAGDDMSDLAKYIQEVKAIPKGTIDPLAERKIVESFILDPNPITNKGFRDPFAPFEGANGKDKSGDTCASESRILPNFERRKEELEEYSLDTLRMVGTLTMNNGLWALIKASDGTIHRVQKGNYMGRNHGAIIRILNDKIELREIVPDKPCAWKEHPFSIALSE